MVLSDSATEQLSGGGPGGPELSYRQAITGQILEGSQRAAGLPSNRVAHLGRTSDPSTRRRPVGGSIGTSTPVTDGADISRQQPLSRPLRGQAGLPPTSILGTSRARGWSVRGSSPAQVHHASSSPIDVSRRTHTRRHPRIGQSHFPAPMFHVKRQPTRLPWMQDQHSTFLAVTVTKPRPTPGGRQSR